MGSFVLHVGKCDKFLPPFISYIKNNFDYNQHKFLLRSGMADKELRIDKNIYFSKGKYLNKYKYYLKFMIMAHRADKVILHGLFDSEIIRILFFLPWLLKKSYWVMWGGDVYRFHKKVDSFKKKIREFYRRNVIRKMGHFIAYTTGEYENLKNWYGAKGKLHRCFMYESNLYHPLEIHPAVKRHISILVGNSADPGNNHDVLFSILEQYRHEDIRVFVPLTYGKNDYADTVIRKGEVIFGEKFFPLTAHMEFSKYLTLLADIDIAVFGHERQQAMGTIRTLLGLGKKVYMNQDLTSAKALIEDNIITFPLYEFSLDTTFGERQNNIENVKRCFSEKVLKDALTEIFN